MCENTPETPALMPDVPRNQRIVLEHTCGPHKGLLQIMGHSDFFGGQAPPTMTEEFDINPGARRGRASLVRAFPRYLLYREITAPEGIGTFDPRQR